MIRFSPQTRCGRFIGLAVLGGVLGGCRPDPSPAPRVVRTPESPPVTPSVATRASEPDVGGEAIIPSNGQPVDARRAVDVVRAEIQGGEADARSPTPPDYRWQLADVAQIRDQQYPLPEPKGLPSLAAVVPASNPMTRGRVELGKQLFYDPRISLDSSVSCASCHDPARAWTDNRVASVGIGNRFGTRNSPTILNTAFRRSQFWDGRAPSLELQAQGPIQNKIEMGDQSYRQIIERLRAVPGYRDQFRRVFGTDVTLDGLAKAIASFERLALSGDSAYDRYARGDDEDREAGEFTDRTFRLMTPSQKSGMVLFGLASDLKPNDPDAGRIDAKLRGRAKCTDCHSGSTFSDEQFHNLGVGFNPARGEFADLGRFVISPVGAIDPAERGAFKTPGLRDVSRTAPYMHDGSEATLEAVVEFYNRGGVRNPTLDPRMAPLNLSATEKADLVAFLKALDGRIVAVTVPILPAGPNGVAPDPRAALNHPGPARPGPGTVASARSPAEVHRVVGSR